MKESVKKIMESRAQLRERLTPECRVRTGPARIQHLDGPITVDPERVNLIVELGKHRSSGVVLPEEVADCTKLYTHRLVERVTDLGEFSIFSLIKAERS
jgi:hypothetical protein